MSRDAAAHVSGGAHLEPPQSAPRETQRGSPFSCGNVREERAFVKKKGILGWQGFICTVEQLFPPQLPVVSALKEILHHIHNSYHTFCIFIKYLAIYLIQNTSLNQFSFEIRAVWIFMVKERWRTVSVKFEECRQKQHLSSGQAALILCEVKWDKSVFSGTEDDA